MIQSEDFLKSALSCMVAALCACTAGRTQIPAAPQLWFFLHSYLNSQVAVQQAETTIDRAAAAGYSGVVMWDSGINFLQYSWWDPSYMKQVIQHGHAEGLAVVPLVAPYGHSYDELLENPNLAEGEQVVGTQFKVDPAGKTLQVVNSFSGLVNGGFESGQAGWFGYGDPGASVDNTMTHSGSAAALIHNAPGNCRLSQSFAVQPWRQYHMRMFYRTQGFSGYAQVEVFADGKLAYNRVNQPLSLSNTQGWTQWLSVVFAGPAYSFLKSLSNALRASSALRGAGGPAGEGEVPCEVPFVETPSRATVTRGLKRVQSFDLSFTAMRTGIGLAHWKRVEGSK
jgi:hypothetical protein